MNMKPDRAIKRLLFKVYGPAGWARAPRQITLDLTHRCNLQCPFCFYVHPDSPGADIRKTELPLPFAVLKNRVIDRLPTRDYYLTGGEPFLYPPLEPLLRYLREKDKRVYISTNGTLLTEAWAERIVASALFEKIDFSLHGPEEVHDRISGIRGAFRKTVQAVGFIQGMKQRLGKTRPLLGLACTVNRENIPHLEALARLAREWSVDSLTFGNTSFITAPRIAAHKEFSRNELGNEDFRLSQLVLGAPEHGLNREDIALYIQKLKGIGEKFGDSPRVLRVPPYREEEIWKHYFDFDWVYRDQCLYPWNTLRIAPSGKVIPCLGVVVGDIGQDGADRIWNNQMLRSFRKKLYRAKLFPGCFRCCKLK